MLIELELLEVVDKQHLFCESSQFFSKFALLRKHVLPLRQKSRSAKNITEMIENIFCSGPPTDPFKNRILRVGESAKMSGFFFWLSSVSLRSPIFPILISAPVVMFFRNLRY